jgi:hypothetical protein
VVLVGILAVQLGQCAFHRESQPPSLVHPPLGAAVRHVAVHRPSCLPRRRMFWSIKPIIRLAADAAVRHVAAESAFLPATATNAMDHQKQTLAWWAVSWL